MEPKPGRARGASRACFTAGAAVSSNRRPASVEVHILNGATNFTTLLLQTNSALHPTGVDGSWQFFAN